MGKVIPMIGKRFGRLTVIEEAERPKGKGSYFYICACDCGAVTNAIDGSMLRNGNTKSCGCLRNDMTAARSRTHGKCKSRLYRIWCGMKNRCYNTKIKKYCRYGARGVAVCDEWKNSFETFCAWAMANGYEEHLTIDRIDNDGNYCPENCRWATNEAQCNNRSHHVLLTINGETKTVAEWAKESGVKFETIYARYKRGWTGENLIRETKETDC